MSRFRLVLGLSTLLAPATGMGLGMRLGARLDPATRASAAPGPAEAAPGPDFSGIARQATLAVVSISALQVLRTERSPFFSDPLFQEFFGHEIRVEEARPDA